MKLRRTTLLVTLGLVALLALCTSPATATTYYLDNASFETPSLDDQAYTWYIPGWAIEDSPAGVWNPKDSKFSNLPDGENVAWLHAATISQTVKTASNDATPVTLLANHIYNVSVWVAWNPSFQNTLTASLQLFAGDNLLKEVSLTPMGEFQEMSLSYTGTSASSGLGQNLVIKLLSDNKGACFDQVAVSNVVIPVPPGLLLLGTGLAGLVLLRRKSA